MLLSGDTELPGAKPLPVSLCPPKIPQELAWGQTRASAFRGLSVVSRKSPPFFHAMGGSLRCYCNVGKLTLGQEISLPPSDG
jgi:hypothetical protein